MCEICAPMSWLFYVYLSRVKAAPYLPDKTVHLRDKSVHLRDKLTYLRDLQTHKWQSKLHLDQIIPIVVLTNLASIISHLAPWVWSVCCDSANRCSSTAEWDHWIGLRMLTTCACAADCTMCRELWQWQDGSSTANFSAWHRSHPALNNECAVIGSSYIFLWYSQLCSRTSQVFCKKGMSSRTVV